MSMSDIIQNLSQERKKLDTLIAELKAVDKLSTDFDTTNYPKLSIELKKVKKTVEKTKIDDTVQREILEKIGSTEHLLFSKEKDFKNCFESNLYYEFEKKDIKIDRLSEDLLKYSLFVFEPDYRNFKVTIWYGYENEKIDTCEMDVDSVVKKTIEVQEGLKKYPFTEGAFLSKLLQAYQNLLGVRRLKFGEEIPIFDILQEYVFLIQGRKFRANPKKENFTDYSSIQFSYDLYRLSSFSIDNYQLHFIPATFSNTRKGESREVLWVPSKLGDQKIIRGIKFVEANHA